MRRIVWPLVLLAVAAVLAVVWGARRWDAESAAALARLRGAKPTAGPSIFRVEALDSLPAPVARYLRAVLREGQSIVREAFLQQRGMFLVRSDTWQPFTARHIATVAPAGFLWDARIMMVPGLAIRVRDAWIDGEGSMRASIGGLFSLADVHGTPDMATASLQRYLAESAWYPTALLPGQGVAWSAVDDSTARATLASGTTTASLTFHFGADSLVARVFAATRAREVEGRMVPTPWQGRWHRYGWHGGMRIPVEGSVEWVLPEGPKPYWRGEIVSAEYATR